MGEVPLYGRLFHPHYPPMALSISDLHFPQEVDDLGDEKRAPHVPRGGSAGVARDFGLRVWTHMNRPDRGPFE